MSLLDQNYQKWIAAIEKGVGKFESSTGTFMTDMIRFGPPKYDIENAQGRWGNLRIYYPSTTLRTLKPGG